MARISSTVDGQTVYHNDILVPYLLAQSVIKPLFTHHTLQQYQRFAEQLQHSDEIVVVGYGFGHTDSHISALIRRAITEEDTTRCTVLLHHSDSALRGSRDDTNGQARQAILKRIRLFEDPSVDRLRVGVVNDDRQVDGLHWLDWVEAW